MSRYVVYDLEMCKVPKGDKRKEFGSHMELIQIGAVLLDENYEVVDVFSTYVEPKFGEVDRFIEELTGITPEKTKNAPSTEEALKAFVSWMPEDVVMVSWSESDEKQLYREIDGKQIVIPRLEDLLYDSIDCQYQFEYTIHGSRAYSLTDALRISGIEGETGAHDALIDAYNTALIFAKINLEPNIEMSKFCFSEDDMCKYMAASSSGLLPNCVYS